MYIYIYIYLRPSLHSERDPLSRPQGGLAVLLAAGAGRLPRAAGPPAVPRASQKLFVKE